MNNLHTHVPAVCHTEPEPEYENGANHPTAPDRQSADPRLKLPDALYLLGLVLFVYTIGLSSGPAFFASLRRHGVRDNLLVVGALVLGLRYWRDCSRS
jgi:hypothetical protein